MICPYGTDLIDSRSTSDQVDSRVVLSACESYRYSLTRVWDKTKPLVAFVMLNPSTADAQTDDPTIRRCLGFARSWGAGGLFVSNLFGLRSTNPGYLRRHRDPVGPYNDMALASAADLWTYGDLPASHVIAAWGVHGDLRGRASEVVRLLQRRNVRVQCLGVTKLGQPRHPLYLAANTEPEDYIPI